MLLIWNNNHTNRSNYRKIKIDKQHKFMKNKDKCLWRMKNGMISLTNQVQNGANDAVTYTS